MWQYGDLDRRYDFGRTAVRGHSDMAIPPHPQIPQVPDTLGSKFGRHPKELGCVGLSLMILVLLALLAIIIFVW